MVTCDFFRSLCLQVFHLNFSVLLDGTTAVRSVLDQWTAEWNVAKFLCEVS